jgi:hypothetical protein
MHTELPSHKTLSYRLAICIQNYQDIKHCLTDMVLPSYRLPDGNTISYDFGILHTDYQTVIPYFMTSVLCIQITRR